MSYGPDARLDRSLPSVCSSGVNRVAADSREERAQPLRAGELELDEGMVVQILADAARLEDGGDPRRLEVGRIADARALQDRGRAVCTCGEDDGRGRDPQLVPVSPNDDLDTAARARSRCDHRAPVENLEVRRGHGPGSR